ncbi:hypothetical protein L596_004760 [Steinernema carpocapsae]|uniref:Ground-like domain-containing protein n=1 Tax=Steinernema carpocapsae TaxID=34508 RepID=A0A4U8V0D7_STECR|nr:hypothetical protein L596_004760 [Steinernema carpocapsae]
MELLFLFAVLLLCASWGDARSTAACHNLQLKKIIDESIVANNLALSSANIRRQLASTSEDNFVVICDEKPVTFASPNTVFCQRSLADVFCTVIKVSGSPVKKITHVHPPLSSEAIISTRREKPLEFESSEIAHVLNVPATTLEPLSPNLRRPTQLPVTETILTSEATAKPVQLTADSVSTTEESLEESAEGEAEPETTTSAPTSAPLTTTTLAPTPITTAASSASPPSEAPSDVGNGDSFFEMMIANQEDARRSMMNTSPPSPLQVVDDKASTALPVETEIQQDSTSSPNDDQ